MTAAGGVFTELPDLEATLREWLSRVPPGHVVTCGTLAELLGDRQAARWIGMWLGQHEHDRDCHCHRIVRAGGRVGGFLFGGGQQAELLRAEGAPIQGDTVAASAILSSEELDRLAPVPCGERPFRRLQELQRTLRTAVRIIPLARDPKDCGGVDISYRHGKAVAVYCRVLWPSGEKVYETWLVRPVAFPYITGYLSFRELPPMLAVLEQAARDGQLAEVIAVDGSGLLHPRSLGIASHLGVVINRPTIGLTKTLLCGEVDMTGLNPGESRPVFWEGQIRGAVLRSSAGHAQPVVLSVGHLIDVEGCLKVIRPLFGRHRLPEPIYWADRTSRAMARRLG